jgi:hypothetical protein
VYLAFSFVLVALAGCGGGWFMEQREPWRHDAELNCLKSGQVKVSPAVAQLPAISGPGICGADFPLKVAALGESSVLGFADELRPPATIPQYSAASPGSYPQSPYRDAPPQPTYRDSYPQPTYRDSYPQRTYRDAYPQPSYGSPPGSPGEPGAPLVLKPQEADPDAEEEEAYPSPAPVYKAPAVSRPLPLPEPTPSRPYSMREGPYDPPRSQPPEPYYTPPPRPYGGPRGSQPPGAGPYGSPPAQSAEPLPPLGPAGPALANGPATFAPPATLACPMVSALDQWISASVQPAALRWFGQPVVEIKQISAYSCRGMNGNRHARISEHAFGNALDVAAFTLADGRKVTVRDGWRGLPEERGFLRDLHAAACQQFSTVLGPGSNIYHYDHLHLDLMRRSSGRNICNPAAIPGDVVAGRRGEPAVTGAVANPRRTLGFVEDRSLPHAVAGED